MSKLLQDMPKVEINKEVVPINSEVVFNRDSIVGEVEKYLGVDAGIPLDVKNRLDTIIDVVSDGKESIGDVLIELRKLQNRVGAAYYGSEAINRIYNYARLIKNRMEIDKKMKAYEVQDAI